MGALGKTSNTSNLLFLYILLAVILIFLDSRRFFSPIKKTAQNVLIPFQSSLFITRAALFGPITNLSSSQSKEEEITKLKEENAKLLAQVTSLKAVEEENEKARHLLGAALPPSWHFEPARVVSVFADKIFVSSSFTPDVGTPVVLSADKGGVFIGEVESIQGNVVSVLLPTSGLSKITALVRDKKTGERHASGIIEAKQGKLFLQQVLTSETLKEGGLVVTGGDEKVPPDLLIGTIVKVLPSTGTFQEAEVKQAIPPESLEFVFFITKF